MLSVLENGMTEYKRIANQARGRNQPRPADPAARRELFEEYAAVFRQPYPGGLAVYDRFVPAPGREIPVRVYQHKERPPGKPQPTILFLHGGGYIMGSLDSHATVAANIARGTGAQVVAVHYRRAPENPYPAGLDDAMFILRWVSENAPRLDVDRERIAVAGDSAGGGLTAALCLLARDRDAPAIAMQVLLYPGPMNIDYQTPSYLNVTHDPQFTAADLKYNMESYLMGASRSDPYAVPLQATDFSVLPPAFIHVAELDPLLDEGVLYGKRLDDAGVSSTVRLARRLEHSFLRAVTVSQEAREEARVLYRAIRDRLHITESIER